MDFILMLLGAFLGGVLSIITTLLTEYFRLPKLSIVIEENHPIRDYEKGRPAKKAKFLHVKLWNRPANKFNRIVNKLIKLNAAVHCHGEIQFYHHDNGSPILATPMRLRWAGSDDHVIQQVQNGKLVEVWDLSKINASYWRTCYPEKIETIDIAARFDDDQDCYGWTTECMINEPLWRKPHLILSKGRYLVQVTVKTEATEVNRVFRLENTSSIENFRLLEASKEDEAMIKKYKAK